LTASSLLGFLVSGVLFAETAVLAHFKTVRVVLFVFHRVIVALLALGARQSDSDSHMFPPDSIDVCPQPVKPPTSKITPEVISPSPKRQNKKASPQR